MGRDGGSLRRWRWCERVEHNFAFARPSFVGPRFVGVVFIGPRFVFTRPRFAFIAQTNFIFKRARFITIRRFVLICACVDLEGQYKVVQSVPESSIHQDTDRQFSFLPRTSSVSASVWTGEYSKGTPVAFVPISIGVELSPTFSISSDITERGTRAEDLVLLFSSRS